jgi:hypothetical protein
MALCLFPEEFLNVQRSRKDIFMQLLFQKLIDGGLSISLGRLLQDFDIFAAGRPGIEFSIQAFPRGSKSQSGKQFFSVD